MARPTAAKDSLGAGLPLITGSNFSANAAMALAGTDAVVSMGQRSLNSVLLTLALFIFYPKIVPSTTSFSADI